MPRHSFAFISLVTVSCLISFFKPSFIPTALKNVYNFSFFKNEFNPPINAKLDVNDLYRNLSEDLKLLYQTLDAKQILNSGTKLPLKNFTLLEDEPVNASYQVNSIFTNCLNLLYNSSISAILISGFSLIIIFFLIRRIVKLESINYDLKKTFLKSIKEHNSTLLSLSKITRENVAHNLAMFHSLSKTSNDLTEILKTFKNERLTLLAKQLNLIKSLHFNSETNLLFKKNVFDTYH